MGIGQVMIGKDRMLRYLDLNLQTPTGGNSVLHLLCTAASANPSIIDDELVEELLSKGADPKQRNEEGEPPVQLLIPQPRHPAQQMVSRSSGSCIAS